MNTNSLNMFLLLLLLTFTTSVNAQKVYYYNELERTRTDDNRTRYDDPQKHKPLNGACRIIDSSSGRDTYYLLTMKKGFQDGKESYYKRGRLETECYYANGLRHGTFKKYTADGKVERNVNYKSGKIDGPDTYYFTDGSIEKEINYKDGVLDGREVTYSWETKKPTTDRFYKNGKPLGKQTEHVWNNLVGDYTRISNFTEEGMTECTEYYPDGKIKQENTRQPGGIRITKEFYTNGNLASEELYKDNKKNGEQKWYDTDGKLERTSTYVDNQKAGPEKEFYPTGILKSEKNFANERREGVFTEYYANGSKKSESTYVRGRCTGPFKIYYDNGQLQEEGAVTDNDYETRKIYYKNGQLKSHQTLNDGVLTEIEKYDENGKQL